jgi:2-dehydropantoate 2-reductase
VSRKGGEPLSQLLAGSFVDVDLTDEWTTVAWEKLMENSAFGGLGVLGLTSNRSLCADAGLTDLLLLLMNEVAQVGRACGARIPDARVTEILTEVCSRATDKLTSIAFDRLEGMPSEWEARNGVVGRLGRRHEIPTPVNDWLVSLVELGEPDC